MPARHLRRQGGGGSPPPPPMSPTAGATTARAGADSLTLPLPRPPRQPRPRHLEPERLPDHIDALYRAAWALCGSRHDADDLVQETFAAVLKRPRLLRADNELGYL